MRVEDFRCKLVSGIPPAEDTEDNLIDLFREPFEPALEVVEVEYLWYDLLSFRSDTFIKRGFGVLKMLRFS